MKVDIEKTAFQPIVVTIETHAEWMALKRACAKYTHTGDDAISRQICHDLQQQLTVIS